MQSIYTDNFIKYGYDAETANILAMNAVIMTEGAIILSVTQKNTLPLRQLADNLPLLFNLDVKPR